MSNAKSGLAGGVTVCPNEAHAYFAMDGGKPVLSDGNPMDGGPAASAAPPSEPPHPSVAGSATIAHSVAATPERSVIAVLDLFGGCGGLSTGFVQAGGFEVVVACEWDKEHPAIAKTYQANHPGTRMVSADITLEDTKQAICRLFEHRPCDVVIGGPPCVAFSMSGRRDPDDPRGRLFQDYIEVVRRIRPAVVIMENVPGVLSPRKGEKTPVIELVAAGLRDLGYHVEHRVLNAADYGVPQQRRRVILMAARPGMPIRFPLPTHAGDAPCSSNVLPWVSVRDAIRDLEDAPEDKARWHVHVRSCPEFLERIRRTPPGRSASLGYHEVFQRLFADKPSVTIKGNHGGLPLHYAQDRIITPREMARLQDFPDSYRFLGSKSDVLLMIGNAVPCGLARAVARSVRTMLDGGGLDSPRDRSGGRNGLAGAGSGFRFVDLFSGIGGFRRAMEGLGGECVFSSEIDKHARRTYEANYGEAPSGDITQIRAEDIPSHHILCGGFPCQDLSLAGRRKGLEGERSRLFFEIVRILKASRPPVAFLENVDNLVGLHNGATFRTIRARLEDAGYVVFWKVLNASFFGVPTARKRIYIVCFRADLGVRRFEFPKPAMEPVKLADVLLPDCDTEDCVIRNQPVHIDEDAVRRIAGRTVLRTVQVGRIGDKLPASQGYRVYHPNGHAMTLCAEAGGLGAKCGLYLVNNRVRKLHPRECLRVMGFPDSFAIPPATSPEQVRKMAGNSVAVPVVRLIGAEIVKIIGNLPSGTPSRDSAHLHVPMSDQGGNSASPHKEGEEMRAKGTAETGGRTARRLRALGLFAGCGGMDTGFEEAGIEVAAANEYWHTAAETYRLNHPNTAMIEGDITREEVKRRICGAFDKEACDVIIGSPACQPFSFAGKRDPGDPRASLFKDYIEVVSSLRPSAIVMENVPGILSSSCPDGTPVTTRIAKALGDLGYAVGMSKLNAADYGEAQDRERVIIVGWRRGGIPDVARTHDRDGRGGLPRWRTFQDAVGGLPGSPKEFLQFPKSSLRFLKMLKADQNWHDLPRELQAEAAGKLAEWGGGSTGCLRRLAWDKPAPTLTCSPLQKMTCLCHPDEDRPLSVQEYMRLQGFPDSYAMAGSVAARYVQLGNCVPVGLAKAVGLAVKGMLEGTAPSGGRR